MNLGELTATLGVDVRGLAEAQRKFEQFEKTMTDSVSSLNEKMRELGNGFSDVGKELTKYVTSAMIATGGVMFKLAKDFDASIMRIGASVGATKSEMNEWSKSILKMSGNLGKSTQELTGALDAIASEGVRGAKALRVLELSAKASTAGIGSTIQVANLVTTAMSAYGDANVDVAKMIDDLITTSRVGQVSTEQLIGTMGNILPLAASMKVSFRSIGEAMAVATQKGIQTGVAVNALRQMLMLIQRATPATDKAFKDMGSSMEEIKNILETQGMLGVLKKLDDLTKKYGGTAVNKALPGMRQMASTLGIMKGNLEDVSEIQEAFNHNVGVGEEAFAMFSATADHKFNQAVQTAKSGLISLGKTISENIIPYIDQFTKWIGRLIDWYNNLSEANKNLIFNIALFVAGIGPALFIVGKLMNAFTVLSGVTMGLVHVLGLLRLAFLANPIGIAIAGVSALVIGYVALSKSINKVTAEQQAYTDVQKKASSAIASEKAQISDLMKIATSASVSKDQQIRAIKELNKISPEYLGNINQETIRTGEATKKVQDYIAQLEKKAKAQAAGELLIELEKKKLEDLANGVDKHIKGWQKYENVVGYLFSARNVLLSLGGPLTMQQKKIDLLARDEVTRAANSKKYFEDYEKRRKALLGLIDQEITKQREREGAYQKAMAGMDNLSEQSEEQVKITISNLEWQLEAEKKYHDDLKKQIDNSVAYQTKSQTKVTDALGNELFKQLDLRATFLNNDILLEEEASKARLGIIEKNIAQANAAYKQRKEEKLKELEFKPTAWKDYQKELKQTEILSELLGDSFNKNSAEISLYESTLKKLVGEGLGPTNEKVKEVSSKLFEATNVYKQLADESNKLKIVEAKLGDQFDMAGKMIELYSGAIDRAGKDSKYTTQDIANLKEELATWVETKGLEEYNKSIKDLSDRHILLGKSVDDLEENLNSAVNTFLYLKAGGVDPLSDAMQGLLQKIGALGNLKDFQIDFDFGNVIAQADSVEQAFLDMDATMAFLPVRAKLMGESFNLTKKQLEIMEATLQRIGNLLPGTQFTPEQIEEIRQLTEAYKALGGTFDEVKEKQEGLTEAFNSISMAISQMGGVMKGTAGSWVQWIAGIVESIPKIIGMLVALGLLKTAKDAETAATNQNTMALATNTAMSLTNTAVKTGEMAVGAGNAVVGATEAGAKLPFPLNIAAIAVGVAAVIGALASIPKAKGATKMAQGGIVPPGYNNDTYPAMLTSGEAVIPAKKLPEFTKEKVDLNVTVQGVVRGSDLHYIIKEVDRKYKNSY